MAAGTSAVEQAHAHLARAERLRAQLAKAERDAEMCAKGAVGEVLVGQLLDSFAADGYFHIDDRRLPGSKANIDHVLVGPTGVWIVDAKNWSGSLTLSGKTLRQNERRRDDRTEFLRIQAQQVAALLESKVPAGAVAVRPAMCFVGEARIGGHVPNDRVHLVDFDCLHEAVRRQPATLNAAQVAAITKFLEKELPPRSEAAARPAVEPVKPADAVVYLQAWKKAGRHRLYEKADDGTQIGYLDVLSGEVHASTSADEPLLARLLPHYARSNGRYLGGEMTEEARGVMRRFLDAVLRRSDEPPVVAPIIVGSPWRGHGKNRLYVHRIDSSNEKVTLGWHDLESVDHRVDVADMAGVIVYCGSRYNDVTARR